MIAFEPQPELARALADVCQSIGLSNVNVIAKGVYSHSGNRDLFVPEGHQPGTSFAQMAKEVESFTILNVPVATLDEYFDASDRITLLKIDVEGAEFGVLKGAERILRQHAPLLVFECENRHLAPGNMEGLFSSGRARTTQQFHLSQSAWATTDMILAAPRLPCGRRCTPARPRRRQSQSPGGNDVGPEPSIKQVDRLRAEI